MDKQTLQEGTRLLDRIDRVRDAIVSAKSEDEAVDALWHEIKGQSKTDQIQFLIVALVMNLRPPPLLVRLLLFFTRRRSFEKFAAPSLSRGNGDAAPCGEVRTNCN